jgi:hypothetical protein
MYVHEGLGQQIVRLFVEFLRSLSCNAKPDLVIGLKGDFIPEIERQADAIEPGPEVGGCGGDADFYHG